ncbi:leucyl/phenylalanyl-tRNA--protein transferase [Sulfidibacter corallicola]|uniref:Leucyl/phenylalanyl-tRNA--protein transferase n=1 Tax=Sulfidibacter corallicola TaxID=2818388 RepID=A0A8A4TER6_SULCO|nr:leucyl/phenylalanyl-tRNA--protein transferase [Sulfidibacter corallicola]QTD48037.1 leucyl/phenylalanyl-tRNA--protein transferase [Sulfidibacter corallicola]
MTIFQLDDELWFPNPRLAEKRGIVAVGGDLRPERLIFAYRTGIFPWYSEEEPIIWWSPDPRFVLYPKQFKLRRSLRKTINKGVFEIRYDTAFDKVVEHCALAERPDQDGTWIVNEMQEAYKKLHEQGLAHSIEAYQDGELVGGLYGVAMGPFFFGESMFYLKPDASKVALVALVNMYREAVFIDCQVANDFFTSMGGTHIPRDRYLDALWRHRDEPGLWNPSWSEAHEEPTGTD